MAVSIFDDKAIVPDMNSLKESLGNTYSVYESITNFLNESYSDIHTEWKHYGKTIGWTLKVLLKKGNLFFITLLNNSFNISFIFGDKAIEKIKESDISQEIIDTLVNAKKYAEGRGIKMEIFDRTHLTNLLKLINIKIRS